MRNLTLGVLIVSAGTLAALPFRRPPSPSADLVPDSTELSDAAATQPVPIPSATAIPADRNAIAAANAAAIAKHAAESELATQKLEAEMRAIDTFASGSSPSFSWNQNLHAQKQPSARGRQSLRPLTYEDLAVPLTRPAIVEDRFSATVSVYEKTNQQAASVPADSIPVDSLAVGAIASMKPMNLKVPEMASQTRPSEQTLNWTNQIARGVTSATQKASPSAERTVQQNATFASTPSREVDAPLPTSPLPVSAADDHPRERFWIQQPQ
ncbi:hypothetical protein [Planctomycetes bacterium CA13]|uniref:hypothetical protein n=1 Tax=Novipirellula herctigrandis TaxID=2527986 RepID=UPI0011B78C4A